MYVRMFTSNAKDSKFGIGILYEKMKNRRKFY